MESWGRFPSIIWAIASLLTLPLACAAAAPIVSPASVLLESPEASQQLLVSVPLVEGRTRDVTHEAEYAVAHPDIARVEPGGRIRPLAEGETEVIVRHAGEEVRIQVEVGKLDAPEPVSFRSQVTPILTKARCNSGGCHGKAEGQNGFKLSIFGFDAESDYAALAKEARGRRISLSTPERSLLLLKGTSDLPHGGGRKLDKGSDRYRLLERWIREGARFDWADAEQGHIASIEVEPAQQILQAGGVQQLRVTAVEASGRRYCVTTEAEYESNAAAIADVEAQGLVQAFDVPGEAAILVRYLGHVAVCRITQPRDGVKFPRPPEANLIDRFVWDKLERLGIEPSGPSDDAEFLRRVFLDTIGTLPTADEVRAFLADETADKRSRMIDLLLERDEYADYWTMRWLDILRADQLQTTPQGTVAMQRWLRRQFAGNRPYDQLARELLTVQGNTVAEGPGAFYKVVRKPDEISSAISQLLLGVRIECAECHHHPSERWSQSDYVGLAGFFTGVTLKKLPGGDEAIVSLGGKDLPHPRTGESVAARALGAEPVTFAATADRRQALADWMTTPENPFFAKAITNRLWAHYFGRGLVEPIDDLRDTNPASNEPLMSALADHMRDVRFDLKAFTRTLLNSRAYQLSSRTTTGNEDDIQNFSHARYRAVPAEVLLDAICRSTGVAEKFNGWPEGYRAIQVWDNRMPSYFFSIFGRPVRATVCECERSNEPSIAQALHLLNSPEITAKIQHRHGRARALANSNRTPEEIVDELYLWTLSRPPRPEEKALMLQAFSEPSLPRRAAVEDVLWTLLNSREFVFNH